jgi:beta-N-acetylhexosaminidase
MNNVKNLEVSMSSPQELAGQSIMFRFQGRVFNDTARAAFSRIRPGGVILFGDNIASRPQIHALCRELQNEAKALGMPPLLIAIDQEGGLVSRLNADPAFVTPPGPMALSAIGSPTAVRHAARITGEQLRELGINVNFAPVVDVNNNHQNPVIRTRSFGDRVEAVIEGALATITGLHDTGVAATVKHFPGHGDTHVDSHLGLPVISHDRDRLRLVELAPFQAAIDAGVSSVMTSHIVFSTFDELPATLSRTILTDLLRGEMGFDGVIFTDSMSMKAIDDRYGPAESAIRAKAAGVDMLEANEPPEVQVARHGALVEGMVSGSLDRRLFTRTVERLDALRERFGIGHEVLDLPAVPEQREADALELARRAIVSVAGRPFRPVDPAEPGVIIDFQRHRGTEAEDPVLRGQLVRDLAARMLPNLDVVTIPHDPASENIDAALRTATGASTLIFLTRDATDNSYQVDIARQVISVAAPHVRVIHIALRGPYDTGLIVEATDRLATYGDPAVTLQAVIEVLAGIVRITGTSPITI